jgi:iron(III) transport system permease protein
MVRYLTRKAWALLLLLVCAAPLAAVVLKGAARARGDLLVHLAATVLPMQLGFSLVAAAGAVLVGALLASGGALCGLFDFPGRGPLQGALLVPLLIPAWFLAVLYQHRLGASGPGALVLVLGIGSAPLFQLFLTASLRGIAPQYIETLRQLGRSSPLQLVRHLFPLTAPSLAAAAVLVFLLAWADAGSARVLAVPTLTVGLYDQWFGRGEDSAGALIALAVLAMSLLPALVVWACFPRGAWRSSARLLQRGAGRIRLRGAAAAVPWMLSAPQLLAGVVFPCAVIGIWTVDRIGRVNIAMIGRDALGTVLLAGGGTLVAAALALWLQWHQVAGHARRLASAAGYVMISTFAAGPVVIGLAFLWLLPSERDGSWAGWLNATPLPLVAALGVRFCAVLSIAGQAALLRTARVHADAIRMSGRTGLLSFLRLLRPYMTAPLAAAACFVFLESLKDISLSLLLQPFGFTTISTRLFQYAQTQRIPESAVWVFCLALVGVYPLWSLARLADSRECGVFR